MNDYNETSQNPLLDINKSQELDKGNPEDNNNYSDNSENDKLSDRKEYPVKSTTFGKIKYV